MKVITTKGLIEFSELEVKDTIELGENHRKIATEYYLDGELVRRDVAISALRGLSCDGAAGSLNGS